MRDPEDNSVEPPAKRERDPEPVEPPAKRERDPDNSVEPPAKSRPGQSDSPMEVQLIAEVFACSESDAVLDSLVNAAGSPSEVNSVGGNEFWDDLSGKPLRAELVRKARMDEMGEVAKHGVYRLVPIAECWEKTGKGPIGTRWVDVNKGDDGNPEYRSRLVAQEINDHKREDLFAATPPLESKKLLFSLAVTEGVGCKEGQWRSGQCIDFIDVKM